MADRALATSLYLALAMKRPLLLEGEAGVGKTAIVETFRNLQARSRTTPRKLSLDRWFDRLTTNGISPARRDARELLGAIFRPTLEG